MSGNLAEACILEFFRFVMVLKPVLCVHPRKQHLHVLQHILEFAMSLESNDWNVYQVK